VLSGRKIMPRLHAGGIERQGLGDFRICAARRSPGFRPLVGQSTWAICAVAQKIRMGPSRPAWQHQKRRRLPGMFAETAHRKAGLPSVWLLLRVRPFFSGRRASDRDIGGEAAISCEVAKRSWFWADL
jgi:hypothetical protein